MGHNLKDHYQLLGLERDANTEQIKEAYRELARIFHPDSNYYSDIVGESLSGPDQDLFKKITDAYNTLSNAELRALYDENLGAQFKTWEDEEEDPNEWESPEQYMRWKRKEQSSTARTFGSQIEEFDNDDTDLNEEESDYVVPAMSVSQMIKFQREPSGPGRSFFLVLFLAIIATALLTILYLS